MLALLCVAATAIVPSMLPVATFTVAALTSVSLLVVSVSIWRAGWMGRRFRSVRAVWDRDGNWWLADNSGSGKLQAATLISSTRVTRHLIWLHWATAEGRRQMLLLRWAFSSESGDSWRNLLVRLRMQGAASMVGMSDRPIPLSFRPREPGRT